MPVAGISTTMASTASWTATDWITNQSCNRLAALFTASHRPGASGASSLGFDRSGMSVLRGGRYALSEPERIASRP